MTAVKMLWGPATIGQVSTTNGALTGTSLSNATTEIGWSFALPKTGSITDVGVYLTAENGTSPAFNVGLVTLDSSGRPTTTAYGGSAITSAQWTSTGWKWVTLSTPATAQAGDFAAVHVYPGATPPDGSNNVAIISSNGVLAVNYGVINVYTGLWTGTTGQPPMAIRYSGGEIHGFALSSNTVHIQIRSNTTPDEAGCLFTLPAAMTCYGAKFYALTSGWGSAATADIVLYDTNGVLASATISDKDFVDDSAVISVFWDAVNLSANTSYRLIIKPGVGTNGDIYTPKWTFESAAALATIPEGARWQYTSRTDAGAWDDTATTAVCPMGLWVSDITFVQGSGSGGAEWGFVG